jgi:hypothetical protein
VRKPIAAIDVLSPKGECLICVEQKASEGYLIGVLLEMVGNVPKTPGGVCLAHGRQVLGRVTNAQTFEDLRNWLISGTELNRVHLGEIVRKHDHRFKNESPGDEVGAGKRTVGFVHGLEGKSRA